MAGIIRLQKIRVKGRKGEDYYSYRLGLPNEVGRTIDHLVGKAFTCHVTDEGILFRPIELGPPVGIDLPPWAKKTGK